MEKARSKSRAKVQSTTKAPSAPKISAKKAAPLRRQEEPAVDLKSGFVQTSDGVTLRYLEAGSGRPLVMIPGWCQTAEQFKHQIAALSKKYRVIAIDMRGHGASAKPEFGFRISRLAKDLYDVIYALDLKDVVLLGHSMGCSIIWCYWDLFGSERIHKLVLVDQMACAALNPAWSKEEAASAGAIFNPETIYGLYNSLVGPQGEATIRGLFGGMLLAPISDEVKEWCLTQSLQLPKAQSATLFFNHAVQDWRDVIPRINVPTLIVGAAASPIPLSATHWIHQQIKGSQLRVFEASEGGQHFVFLALPDRFNNVVSDFIG